MTRCFFEFLFKIHLKSTDFVQQPISNSQCGKSSL